MSIADDLRRLVASAVADAADCVQTSAQTHAPRREGTLASSIRASVAGGGSVWRVTVEQDDGVAPYGAALDHPRAGRIYPVHAKALGPFQHAGETMFRKSVAQSTAHTGWWTDYPWRTEFESCLSRGLRS